LAFAGEGLREAKTVRGAARATVAAHWQVRTRNLRIKLPNPLLLRADEFFEPEDQEKSEMSDLILSYAQGFLEYQVLISACLIVFVFYAVGRDVSRSLNRVEDELGKIVNAIKQTRRD
jgi:hypothetical protein